MFERAITLITATLFLPVALSSAVAHAETKIAGRLELLKGHMTTLHDDAEFDRKLGGGLSIGLGAPFIAGAAYADHLCSSKSDEEDDGCTVGVWALGITGGVLIGVGLLILALPGEEETLTGAWLGDVSDGSGRAMVLRGEGVLRQLAESGRQSRYINGGVFVGLAALSAVSALEDSASSNAGVVTSVVFWGGLAVLQFALSTPAEEQWEGYQDAVRAAGHELSGQEAPGHLFMSLAPALDGGSLVAGVQF